MAMAYTLILIVVGVETAAEIAQSRKSNKNVLKAREFPVDVSDHVKPRLSKCISNNPTGVFLVCLHPSTNRRFRPLLVIENIEMS